MNFDNEFENFDDMADNFDDEAADNFKGKPQAAVRRSASFDLTMVNAGAEDINVELFNALGSFTKKRNLALINSATALLFPLTSLEGIIANGVGCVGFDSKARLVVCGAAAAIVASVDCPQYGYRNLMEASAGKPFLLKALRMTTTTDGQIDNEIVHFTNTFLGAKSQNTINPRTSFRPDQFQNKIIDIPVNWEINGEKGLIYKLNAGETVKWNVIIER